MWSFVEHAAQYRPPIAVFESVQQAYKSGHELMTALRARLEELTGERYDLYHVFQNAYELGGVARRPRYFWVASRVPFGVEYPRITYHPTLADAWRDLDGLGATWLPQPYRRPATSLWAAGARNGNVTVDGHVGHTNLNAERIKDVLECLHEIGGWPQRRALWSVVREYYEKTGKMPQTLEHKLPQLLERDWEMGFTQAYRWPANEPARVIVGGALSLVVHPWQDRLITHREAARIMGFPDDWLILPLKGKTGIDTSWGKGITTNCGRWIATWVRAALDGEPGSIAGEEVADRERLITHPSPIKQGRVGAKWQQRDVAEPVRELVVA